MAVADDRYFERAWLNANGDAARAGQVLQELQGWQREECGD
jgi:hypothetical protein